MKIKNDKSELKKNDFTKRKKINLLYTHLEEKEIYKIESNSLFE